MSVLPPFGKVAVLMGGRSAEREVSLTSGSMVLKALQSKGVHAMGFDPAQRPLQDLVQEQVQKVFIALHGRFGEDGTVQGALELLGIPYTGSGVVASAMAMDKVLTKRLWATEALPMPLGKTLRRREYENLKRNCQSQTEIESTLLQWLEPLRLPVIVKPPLEGSTLGLSRVQAQSQLVSAIALCLQHDDAALIEELIEGPEYTVALLEAQGEVQALPVIEIRAHKGNYDYEHKYHSNDTQYLCPAPISESLAKQMQALACQAFSSLGCESWARVDIMLRARDQQPFLLEINTSPGMTDHSLVPIAARAVGTSYEDLVLKVLAGARLKTSRGAV
jgi:D-alanine-D-alanine ligase